MNDIVSRAGDFSHLLKGAMEGGMLRLAVGQHDAVNQVPSLILAHSVEHRFGCGRINASDFPKGHLEHSLDVRVEVDEFPQRDPIGVEGLNGLVSWVRFRNAITHGRQALHERQATRRRSRSAIQAPGGQPGEHAPQAAQAGGRGR